MSVIVIVAVRVGPGFARLQSRGAGVIHSVSSPMSRLVREVSCRRRSRCSARRIDVEDDFVFARDRDAHRLGRTSRSGQGKKKGKKRIGPSDVLTGDEGATGTPPRIVASGPRRVRLSKLVRDKQGEQRIGKLLAHDVHPLVGTCVCPFLERVKTCLGVRLRKFSGARCKYIRSLPVRLALACDCSARCGRWQQSACYRS